MKIFFDNLFMELSSEDRVLMVIAVVLIVAAFLAAFWPTKKNNKK